MKTLERVWVDYHQRRRLAPLVYLLFESVFFVMERKLLLGIRQRVEKCRSMEAVGSVVQQHILDNVGELHVQAPTPEAEVWGES
jgi:hypothetical protein